MTGGTTADFVAVGWYANRVPADYWRLWLPRFPRLSTVLSGSLLVVTGGQFQGVPAVPGQCLVRVRGVAGPDGVGLDIVHRALSHALSPTARVYVIWERQRDVAMAEQWSRWARLFANWHWSGPVSDLAMTDRAGFRSCPWMSSLTPAALTSAYAFEDKDTVIETALRAAMTSNLEPTDVTASFQDGLLRAPECTWTGLGPFGVAAFVGGSDARDIEILCGPGLHTDWLQTICSMAGCCDTLVCSAGTPYELASEPAVVHGGIWAEWPSGWTIAGGGSRSP